MIKDAPILADFLDWFNNYCLFDFSLKLFFSESSFIDIYIHDDIGT